MKKSTVLAVFALITVTGFSQPLVSKFVHQNYTLSDSLKSPDGYYYNGVAYQLEENTILMLEAVATQPVSRPFISVKGPEENGAEIVPTLVFFDTTLAGKTQAVLLLNKTGQYNIFFSGKIKCQVAASLGIAKKDWLDDTQIYKTTANSALGTAIPSILRQSIFQFNFMKGEVASVFAASSHKPTITLPGADMESANTVIDLETVLDAALQEHFMQVCSYQLGSVNYTTVEGNIGTWNEKDSSLAIKKYENFKEQLVAALPNDFVQERETVYPMHFVHRDGNWIRHGRSVVFKYKYNDAVSDPSDKYYFLAGKTVRIELCLRPDTFGSKANVFLMFYSY